MVVLDTSGQIYYLRGNRAPNVCEVTTITICDIPELTCRQLPKLGKCRFVEICKQILKSLK